MEQVREVETLQIKDINSIEGMKMLSQGNTAEVFEYNEGKVLKLFREGMPKEPIIAEFEQVCIIQNVVDNIPKAYELIRFQNRFGIIYQKVCGVDMIKVMFGSIFKLKDYAKKLAQYHVDMHRSQVEVGRTVKQKLSGEINNVSTLTNEEKKEILKYLEKLPDGNRLCHMDYHPGNVMYQDNRPVIIDWMTACTGAPAADVARTCLLLQYGEIAFGAWIARKMIGIVQRYIGKVYRVEYQAITHMSDEEIDGWMLPLMAARLMEWLSDHERKLLLRKIKETKY